MDWIADGIHRNKKGHVIPQRATVPPLHGREGILHIGLQATVHGGIDYDGAVIVAATARIEGPIHAGHEVVIGARSQVQDIRCKGRVVIQDQAVTGHVHAGGDIILLGACTTGNVEAGGDIIIIGQPKTGQLSPGGRITTR